MCKHQQKVLDEVEVLAFVCTTSSCLLESEAPLVNFQDQHIKQNTLVLPEFSNENAGSSGNKAVLCCHLLLCKCYPFTERNAADHTTWPRENRPFQGHKNSERKNKCKERSRFSPVP